MITIAVISSSSPSPSLIIAMDINLDIGDIIVAKTHLIPALIVCHGRQIIKK